MRNQRASRKRAGGFSLLEALVAMAIVAIAFTALYRAVGQGTHAVSAVDDRVRAAIIAQSLLASATYAEDLAAVQTGEAAGLRWRVELGPAAVTLLPEGGTPITGHRPLVARVRILVERADTARPVLDWTGWKLYRAQA